MLHHRFRLTSVLGVVLLGLSTASCGRVRIEGEAMAPTLVGGDRVSTTSAVDPLRRGDVIVFDYPLDPGTIFLKRIVGMPGEEIAIVNGRITIDGKPLDEPYVAPENLSRDRFGPVRIPDGQYFVMGDNRRNSSDSRHWGTVRRDLIRAKVPGV